MTSLSPRLVVLGVTQDGGRPQTACIRSCCAPARAAGLRDLVSCIGIIDGEQRFLLDCTPDLNAQLAALGGPPLHGIVLTHAHMGHYTGLLQLGPEAWGADHIPVYAMPAMAAFLRSHAPWCALETDGNLELRLMQRDCPLPLTKRVSITPWLVPHRGPWSETIAVFIRGPNKSAMYLPDIDRWEDWDRDPADLLEQVDRLWCDGTFFSADEVAWRDRTLISHPLVQESLDRFRALPEHLRQKIVFIHLNHTNPLLDSHSTASRQVVDLGMSVAREGEVFLL